MSRDKTYSLKLWWAWRRLNEYTKPVMLAEPPVGKPDRISPPLISFDILQLAEVGIFGLR